jgi:hypothetical protein
MGLTKDEAASDLANPGFVLEALALSDWDHIFSEGSSRDLTFIGGDFLFDRGDWDLRGARGFENLPLREASLMVRGLVFVGIMIDSEVFLRCVSPWASFWDH